MSIIETHKPHIYIHFENDNNLKNNGVSAYLNYWNLKQCKKEKFSCCVDTTAVKDIDLIFGTKQAITIGKFIKNMKKQPYQYLNYTILVISNTMLINLLDIIFKMTKPCAPIYIVKNIDQANLLYNCLKRNNAIEINAYLIVNEIKYILPK